MTTKRKNTIDYRDLIVGSIGLLIGLVIYFYIIPSTIREPVLKAWRGHPLAQSPQFMPKFWTVFWMITSVCIIIQSLLPFIFQVESSKEHLKSQMSLTEWIESLKLSIIPICTIILFVVLFNAFGYLISASFFLAVSLWWFKIKEKRKIVFLTLLLTSIVYVFFSRILSTHIPLL